MNVVERFADAFNRRDVDGLLALFTADATYRDLFYGPHAGETALRGMFERMFHEGRDYRWSIFELVDGRIHAYREYANTGAALLQLGFAPESIAKILRRSLPPA